MRLKFLLPYTQVLEERDLRAADFIAKTLDSFHVLSEGLDASNVPRTLRSELVRVCKTVTLALLLELIKNKRDQTF
jgi:hypothetical protein